MKKLTLGKELKYLEKKKKIEPPGSLDICAVLRRSTTKERQSNPFRNGGIDPTLDTNEKVAAQKGQSGKGKSRPT